MPRLNKTCHSPGNIGAFAMTNYAAVTNWAPQMRAKVIAGLMPPWHADPFYQSFTNDSSLTPTQAQKLVTWINDNTPRGTGPDPLTNSSPATNFPFAWPAELGQPTQIISNLSYHIDSAQVLSVVGYQYNVVTTAFPSNVWLRAAVVRPGNAKVVHHALVFLYPDTTGGG